jgi:hypothetical protein
MISVKKRFSCQAVSNRNATHWEGYGEEFKRKRILHRKNIKLLC